MKLVYTHFNAGKSNEFFEVTLSDNGRNLSTYVFNTKKEVTAFYNGVSATRQAANSLIQSLPMSLTEEKS